MTTESGHFVYMLRCAGNRIYTGYALDVNARFAQHCAGTGARFTKAFPPSSILRVFTCFDKSSALRLEYAIKSLSKVQKEALVIAGQQFQDCCDTRASFA